MEVENHLTEDFLDEGSSPIDGVTLRHIFEMGDVSGSEIKWSNDGRYIAIPLSNTTIVIYNVERRYEIGVLHGHSSAVLHACWSHDGEFIASISSTNKIKIWNFNKLNLYTELKTGNGTATTITFDQNRPLLYAGNDEGNIYIWNINKLGSRPEILRSHLSGIKEISLSSCGTKLATTSLVGNEIKIYECSVKGIVEIGKESLLSEIKCISWNNDASALGIGTTDGNLIFLSTNGNLHSEIEGHTGPIFGLSFSCDGKLIVTKSQDNSVQFRRTDNFEKVFLLNETTDKHWKRGNISFHPFMPLVATFGKKGSIARIWSLEIDTLLNNVLTKNSVRYTTAKIVLVGDSGVGKTGLGWRLAHGEYKEHSSTHGQQFWVIDELGTTREDGTICEAVLWDLAGQHLYRSVHAIFLDDVDMSLVLFDPTNRNEPLKGVCFWLEQLKGKYKLPPSILIGARVDRGDSSISRTEIDQFCQRQNITGGYVSTSASTGEGLENLLHSVRSLIPWEKMTATVTTFNFKRIKQFVFDLKENTEYKKILTSATDLIEMMERSDKDWKFNNSEVLTVLKHLENHGYITILNNSTVEKFILLSPETLVSLAS